MNQKAVSPVIGIILMVAVTVALVGLVTFTVLNISNETENSDVPDSSIKATQTSEGLQTTVIKDENVDEYIIQGPDGREVSLNSDTGSSETVGDGAGQYEVIAITNDGARQVVTKTEIEENTSAADARTSTFMQDGSVSVNPPINGAIVKSTEDRATIDVTQTDSNGEFSVGASEDSNITVIVKGFNDPAIAGPLYASGTKRADKDSSLSFDFQESSADLVSIGGDNTLISYNPDSSEKEIGTTEQLQAIDKITGGKSSNYEIVTDINISDSDTVNNIKPIGNESDPFTGTIDGNGKVIENLKIANSSENNTGLINYSSGANIKNLSFKNPDVDGNHSTGVLIGNSTSSTTIKNINIIGGEVDGESYVGGIVGAESGGTIINVSSSTTVTSNNDDAGGLVGYSTALIKESESSGSVSGTDEVGGLVGDSRGQIENSKSSATVSGTGDVGGLVGDKNAEDIINSNASGTVNGDEYIGGLVGRNSEGDIINSYAIADVNGGSDAGGLVGINYGNIKNSYSKGEVSGSDDIGGLIGDSSDPVTIENSYSESSVIGTGDDVGGLIGVIESGSTVRDTYATGDVSGDGDVGGLIGDGEVSGSSYATGHVTGSGDDVGGLVGDGDVTASSNASGNVSGDGDVGGLIGDGEVSGSSYATGYVTGSEDDVGGLVGDGDVIASSNASGNVSGDTDDVGGLVGDGDVTASSNASGNVNGDSDVGGLIGDGEASRPSYATGNVTGTGDNVGGLIGDSFGDVNSSYATGNIEGQKSVGGLIGDSFGDVNSSYATGDVEGEKSVGGLIGDSFGDVNSSYATGDVDSRQNRTGGLIGDSFGDVKESYATGDVDSRQSKIGGLIGISEGNISNSYSKGLVSGNNKVGGLTGVNIGKINYSYTVSDVSGNSNTGGLTGKNGEDAGNQNGKDGILKDSYWNKEVSVNNAIGKEGGSDSGSNTGGDSIINGDVSGLTTTSMQGSDAKTNMDKLDYAKVWKIQSSDYPIFRDEPVVLVENGDVIDTGETNILTIDQVSGQDSESQQLTTSEFEITDEDNGKVKYTGSNGIYSENDVSFRFTYKIENVQQLQNIQSNLSADYKIVNNIDASDTQNWNTTSNKQVTDSGFGSSYSDPGTEFNVYYSIENVISVSDSNGELANTTVNADQGIVQIDESPSSEVDITYEIQSTDKGFDPIGSQSNKFKGSLDGNGHTISGLHINRPKDNYIGVFGYVDASSGSQNIKDLKLTNIDVNGGSYVGGVVGDIRNSSSSGRILNVSVSGNIVGESSVGGIAGRNYGKTIEESDSNGLIKSTASGTEFRDRDIGGLVGYNSDGNILSSHSNADINTRDDGFGGLIGEQTGGKINNSYATGDITAPSKYDTTEYIGGLVGVVTNSNTVVKNTYSTGDIVINANTGRYVGGIAGSSSGKINNTYSISNISGSTETSGGIVGLNDVATAGDRSYAVVKNSYHKGDIGGSDELGGIAGENRGLINKTYSTGIVTSSGTSPSYVGGLVGKQGKHSGDLGVLEDSYWNSEVSQSKSIGNVGDSDAIINGEVSGLTTSEMQGTSASTNMGTLDFTNTWKTVTNSYPELQD